MLITKKTHYALVAMLDLARNSGDPVKLKDIADRQNLPKAFLDQIFAKLKRSNIVSVQKGPGGGYTLVESPDTLKVSRIVEAVGDFDLTVEEVGESEEAKIINEYLKSLNGHIWAFYTLTISELLKGEYE